MGAGLLLRLHGTPRHSLATVPQTERFPFAEHRFRCLWEMFRLAADGGAATAVEQLTCRTLELTNRRQCWTLPGTVHLAVIWQESWIRGNVRQNGRLCVVSCGLSM